MKPYYQDDWVTIYHGDCLEAAPHIGASDLVLTDPPYNVGVNYGSHDDNMTTDAYQEWCAIWFADYRRISSRTIIFPGHGNLPMWLSVARPSGIGCWYKPGNPKGAGVFQFCEWEPFLLYGKGIGGSDVVRATISEQQDTGNHPCPKPIALFKELILKSKAKTVIDPFLGSGTTLVAAKYLGIHAVGIELEERYCELAANRLAQDVLDFA